MSTIVLATINARYIHSAMGLRCLAASLDGLDATIAEYTLRQSAVDIAADLIAREPTIIGLGVYIWNTRLTLDVVQLLRSLAPQVTVVLGGPETGASFSGLPFDHLLFTGATSIAKHVLSAAAQNLVPVTLELGGKSPVIVSESASMDSAAGAIMAGKMMNAGQICLSPDYVFLPKNRVQEFVESSKKAVAKTFPTLIDNPDYTSLINEKHFDRLNSYIDEAKRKGVEVVEINPANEDFRQQHHNKIPPTLIIDPPEELQVMQDEIFGPVMPIKSYDRIEETIFYVNDRPRPLGLYYFGSNSKEESDVLNRTTSGGVTVNDVVMHYLQEDLPFGGIGPSGMGSYHGEDGFKRFSHAKAIYCQTKVGAVLDVLRPPYGDLFLKLAKFQSK